MWVKICANTNLEDALLAAELGADAVGFVFAPSPRQIAPSKAADIVARLPDGVEKVGVFPAWPAQRILETVRQARLTGVQLHGGLDMELVSTLHAELRGSVALIQVVHWNLTDGPPQSDLLRAQIQELAAMPGIARILIDSKVGSIAGGTGVAFPWRDAQALFAEHPNLILAGGLNPDNVGQAIQFLKPWGVDVAGGVELAPGKKDPHKLKLFVQAARRSEAIANVPTADAIAHS